MLRCLAEDDIQTKYGIEIEQVYKYQRDNIDEFGDSQAGDLSGRSANNSPLKIGSEGQSQQ